MSAQSAVVRGILRANPGRTRLMIAAIAVGVGAVGAILGSFTVIARTIDDSFASTRPPAALLHLGSDARQAEAIALSVPGVTDAQARAEITARLASAEGWQPVTLVATDDAPDAGIARAFPERGAWPPARGELIIERSSLREVSLGIGDAAEVTTPTGGATLTITGTAHDPGRTPAWMFGAVIAYVSPDTLADVGLTDALPTLAVRTEPGMTREHNAAVAEDVASHLRAAGFTVASVDVPVPGQHPARGVMRTLLYLLQAFGIVALVSAIALVATLVTAEIRRSQGRIAIMKAAGASSRRVAGLYLSALAVVAGGGLLGGIAVGALGTWALSAFALMLLNLDPSSWIASWWVFPAQAAVAIGAPLLAVLIPVRALSRVPVREGLAMGAAAPARTPRRTVTAPRWGRAATLGLRNAVRQPGRALLTAASLAVGAAAVMTALNTGAAWDRAVAVEFEAQHYSVQVTPARPVPVGSLDAAASAQGLSRIEYWQSATVLAKSADGTPGARVVALLPPEQSTSATFPLVEGRRLVPGDDHAVVVSQSLTDPSVGVGDRLLLEGDDAPWEVVGVVRQLSGGEDGVVWLSGPLPAWTPGMATMLRVTGADEAHALAATERMMADAGVPIARASTATDAKQSLDNHLYIISGLLLVMALGLGLVGLLGLIEAMTTSITERRGEIALLKTVGAGSRHITRMVVIEAVAAGLAAVALGALLAAPLTVAVEAAVGTIFIGAPLPVTWWAPGVALTAAALIAAAVVASIVPAIEAADLTVRESLARG